MASFDQKLRTLRLMEILLERTDDTHMLNTSELCTILDQEYGISTDRRTIYTEMEIGCLFHINVYSVFDEENEEIKRNAIKLVKEKRVAFLGSDAHRTIHRPPSVKYGLQFLYDYFEKNYIDQIAFGNAEKLLGLME